MKSLDANLAKNVLSDIEDLQWSSLNQLVFLHSYKLLEEKYLLDDKLQHKDAVEDFFAYFRKVWVDSEEKNWFEGANPFASSNNQGIEGKNKEIKAAHTFRKRMPLGAFIDCMLRMVHEWSLEDSSLLTSDRTKILHTKPNGLKLRTDGYSWYRTHDKSSNYVRISTSGRSTVSEDLRLGKVDAIWAVPSSSGDPEMSLKDHAKRRMKARLIPDNTSFTEYLEIRKSCWIIEEREGQFYCDCPIGMKGHLCKVNIILFIENK